MLKIKIGSIYPDTSGLEIPVVMRSPLFSDGKGSYIFNFKLPASDELKAEFGHFHRPGRYGTSVVKRPMQLSFGPLKFSGTASVTMASATYYEISCPIDNGELAQLFKTKKLNELDLGGDRESINGYIGINAETSEDITVEFVNVTEAQIVNVPYNNAIENPDGILHTSGNYITFSENGTYVILFNLDAQVQQGIVSFEIYLNDELYHESLVVNGPFFFTIENEFAENDVLRWNINALPVNVTSGPLEFQILSGSSLYCHKQGVLNENNGLDLYPVGEYVVFPFENSKMFDKLEDNTYQIDSRSIKELYSKYFPVFNYYREDNFPLILTGNSEGESFVIFNLFNPFPYLAYVLRQMFSEFNLTVNNNLFEDVDLKQLVVFNLFAENIYSKPDLINPKPGFNLQDHVPDSLVSDYWINLCRLLGIGFSYKSDTRSLTLRYLKDIAMDDSVTEFPGIISGQAELTADAFNGYRLEQVKPSQDEFVSNNFKSLDGLTIKGTVSTISLLPAPEDSEINDCYYISTRKEWWIFNYDTELSILNWIFYSKDFQHVLEDTDDEISKTTFEVKSEISAIMMNDWDLLDHNLCAPTGREWLIPVTTQPGNFDGLPDYFRSEFSKGLLFYHGLRNDSDENLYPLASNDVFDFEGNQVAFEASGDTDAYTHSLSLKWEGEFGLYEKRYKAWIDMLLRSRGFWQINARMSPLQIAALDMLQWYSAPGYRFLVKELRFKIYHDHISTAEMEMFIK